MSGVTLNEHQRQELRAFIAENEADNEIGAQFGAKPDHVHRLEWFACDVPGTVAVLNHDGFTMRLLLPVPRPVPRDPLFQKARPIDRLWRAMALLQAAPIWRRDWQWEGMTMDAPDEIPAGAREYMSGSEEAFGAVQVTCHREGCWS